MECMVDTFGATARIINRDVREASLQLLKSIELTVDNLVRAQDTMGDFIVLISTNIESIKGCETDEAIDPEDIVCDLLLKSEDTLYDALPVLDSKIAAAKADHELQGDHEDAVVDEYSRLISQVKRLRSSVSEMRWAIMEHDATIDKELSDTFDNVDDLMKSLSA